LSLSFSRIRNWADGSDPDSLSNRLRSRRFALFEALVSPLSRPIRILDIGGTNEFWQQRGWANRPDIQVLTLNLQCEPKLFSNIDSIAGDATDLRQFDDRHFDVAFSNSVIEHLFNLDNQRKMAKEVQRVGKAFWVQTPNFWFPIEPHFHVPGWQWLPVSARIALLRRWRCGWRGPCPDPRKASELVREVRLMTKTELSDAFPGATLVPERFAGLVKSWIVIHGFDHQQKPT